MNLFALAKPSGDEPGEDATEAPADAPDGTGDCPDAIKAPNGLTPARASLARHLAWLAAVEADLEKSNAGKAKLESDLAKFADAKQALDHRRQSDAATLVAKVKSAASWQLTQFGGQDVVDLDAKFAASRHQAAIAELALAQIEAEISHTQAMLSTLHSRKASFVAAAVCEAAEGLYQDYHTAIADLRDAMTRLAGLECHLGSGRPGRVVVAVPDFASANGIEIPVLAPPDEIAAAKRVWSAFAAALAENPRASAEKLLRFAEHDPGAMRTATYHELHPLERLAVDIGFASGER